MERAEKQGLAVAAIGHIGLFVVLSLGLFSARIPKPIMADPMEVTIADTVGMKSAVTEASTEAPKESQAPEIGKPDEDSAPPPPAPEPEPTPPESKPVPPKPTPPKSKPVPPKPTPPEPRPAPAKPKPVPPKPDRKPEPKPEKPKPEKPKPAPEKPKPDKAKSTPEKAAPAKPAPAKAAAKPAVSRKAPGLSSDLLKDLPKDTGTGSGKGKSAAKPKGSRLGPDFLKGIGSDAKGTADKPRAAAVSAQSMAGLASLLLQQVKPCYNPPAGGADAGAIATVLNLRMNPDGSVASVTIGDQTGVNGQNQAYARQMADAARRAVLRCSPFKLPSELYKGGWDDFGFRFRPGL